MERRDPSRRERGRRHLQAAAALAALVPAAAFAETAVDILPGANDAVFPTAGTTHGWQFSVGVPIEVTHLGLYDRFGDGFAIEHGIGLWTEQGALLIQDVLGPGAGDPLFDGFRYVDVTGGEGNGGPVLEPGSLYTIGFYSAETVDTEGMVIFDGFHVIHPAIDYVGFGVADFTDGLEMPETPDEFGLHRWGPNIMFNVVPGPGVVAVLLPGLAATRRARRRNATAGRAQSRSAPTATLSAGSNA